MTRALAPAAILDNPAWSSLAGAHAEFAVVHGQAARYDQEVAPFHALADPADPLAWTDLTRLVGPGDTVTIAGAGGAATRAGRSNTPSRASSSSTCRCGRRRLRTRSGSAPPT